MVSCEGKPDCGCFRCYAVKIREQQQQQQAKRMTWSEAITGVAAVVGVVGVALVGLGVNYLLSDYGSSSSSGKTMIAPGTERAFRILRDEFEANPAGYFRDLRKK